MKTFSVINYFTSKYYGTIEAIDLSELDIKLRELMIGFNLTEYDYTIKSDSASAIIFIK